MCVWLMHSPDAAGEVQKESVFAALVIFYRFLLNAPRCTPLQMYPSNCIVGDNIYDYFSSKVFLASGLHDNNNDDDDDDGNDGSVTSRFHFHFRYSFFYYNDIYLHPSIVY